MDITEYLKNFLGTETPFMLLFVSLFFYYIKSTREREKENTHIVEKKLGKIEEEMQVLIKVWKILLEKELEERK